MARTKGIQSTPHGFRAAIRIHGILHRQHFKKDTPLQTIKEWLLTTETRYRIHRAKQTGYFDEDARAYLDTVKAMPSYADRKTHIEEWIAVFGHVRRHKITADQIRAQLHTWRTTPRLVTFTRRETTKAKKTAERILSASAVNKRRTALMHLFTVLDGKSAPNPVKDVPKFREPDPLPKGLPYSAITALWKVMGDTPSRARLMVLAYTGITHRQLEQLTAGDVTSATVIVPGRQKGAGTRARVLPLTADGVRAFKAMQRTDAWGTFSRSSLRKVFRAACRKVPALAPIADRLTPYDLRHSFGTEVYRISGDMRATQVLMGHSSPTLTHRYTLAAVDPRLTEALKGFGAVPGTLRALSRGKTGNKTGSRGTTKRKKRQ